MITLDSGAGVDEHHVSFFERLRIGAAVGIGRGLSEKHDAEAQGPVDTESRVSFGDKVRDLRGREPFGEYARRRLVHLQSDVLGPLHQCDLGRRLNHAAFCGNQTGIDVLEGVARATQAIESEERGRLVDGDSAMRVATASHRVHHQRRRILVLLPGTHVIAQLEHCTGLLFLESGTDVGNITISGNYRPVQSFAASQAHSGEVGKTRGCVQIEGLDAFGSHQALSFFDAAQTLLGGDGLHAVAHGGHALELGLHG